MSRSRHAALPLRHRLSPLLLPPLLLPLLLLPLMLLLSACGGSDNPPGIQSPPVLPPAGTGVKVDVAAAWQQYLSTPRQWQVSGSQNNDAFTLTLVLTPGPLSSFPLNGQLAQTTTESLRLNVAGIVSADTEGTLFYDSNSLIGIVGGSGPGATCAVVRTPFAPLPTDAAAGTGGTIVALDNFDGCSNSAAKVGSLTLDWSVEQDLAVTLFCLTGVRQDNAGAITGTQTSCVQTTRQGELAGGARLSLRRADGSTISAKNY